MSCKGTKRIEEQRAQDAIDAERWRALINSPYIHLYGFAGNIEGEIGHCGMDFTSRIKEEDKELAIVKEPTEYARKVLITYVDTIRNVSKG